MPPVYDIQSSFAGGEVTPEIQARVDLQKYKTSLATCRNFIPSPHGPVSNRAGTKFIYAAKYTDKKARIKTFQFSTGDAGMLEFGDRYIRFFTSEAILTSIVNSWSSVLNYIPGQYAKLGSVTYQCILANTNHTPPNSTYWIVFDASHALLVAPYEIFTPYLEADIPLLKFAQSGDTVYITHQNYAPMKLQRTFSSFGPWSGGFTLTSNNIFANGPFMAPNTDLYLFTSTAGVVNSRLNSSASFFNANKVGAWLKLEKYIPSFSYVVDLDSSVAPTSSSKFACGGSWKLITTGTWTGTIILEKSEDNGITWTEIQKFVSNNDTNINTFGTEPLVDGYQHFLIRLHPQTLTSGLAHVVLSMDAFTARLVGKIADFLSATQITNPFLGDILFQSNTQNGIAVGAHITIWSEGSFSADRGWPALVSFFQDRLVFAATPTEPDAEWMSQTSDYNNFGTSIPLVDSDSIGAIILSRSINRIRSIISFLNSIVTYTDSSLWNVTSTDDGPISPSNAFSKSQGSRGTGDIDPVIVGDRILFVEPRGSTVREMVNNYLTSVFTTEDIGIISNHLFRDHQITAIAYQQEPDSLVWFLRDDGVLLSLTYIREQEVLSWARHDTNGTIESIDVISTPTEDQLWMIVNRDANGNNRFVERLTQRVASTDPADQYYVDSGVSYDGTPVTTLSGLDNLNGYDVAINADGFVLPQQSVSAGAIFLSVAASKIHVGLPYTSDLQTLKEEFPMRDGGTLQGRRYQIGRATIRYLNSRGGWLGSDEGNIDEVDHRLDILSALDAANPLIPTPLFTGFDVQTIPQSNDSHGSIFFRQVDPMPVTILSILPIVDPGTDA